METTHWSVVLDARDGDSETRRRSLAFLCEAYWAPLYAFVRHKGHSVEEAQDLTQEFFAHVLGRDFLKNVDPAKGRFRNYLYTSMSYFLVNEWHKGQAQKRGGGVAFVALDFSDAERWVKHTASPGATPEALFQKRWALDVLERAFDRLAAERDGPQRERFDAVKAYLTVTSERVPYAELEKATGVSVSALKVFVHRLRKRYGELVRDEIRMTVATESEVDAELRELMSALSDS